MLVPCACSPSSASWGCPNYVTGSEGACIGRGLCCDEAGTPGSRVRRRCLALRTRPPRGTPDCLSWTRPLPPSTDRLLLRCVRRSEKEPLAPAQLLRNPSSTGPARRRPSAPSCVLPAGPSRAPHVKNLRAGGQPNHLGASRTPVPRPDEVITRTPLGATPAAPRSMRPWRRVSYAGSSTS